MHTHTYKTAVELRLVYMGISVSQNHFIILNANATLNASSEQKLKQTRRTCTHARMYVDWPAIDIRTEASRSKHRTTACLALYCSSLHGSHTNTNIDRDTQSQHSNMLVQSEFFLSIELICCAHTWKWLKWGKIEIIIDDDDDDRTRKRKQKKNIFERIVCACVCALFVCFSSYLFDYFPHTFPTRSASYSAN